MTQGARGWRAGRCWWGGCFLWGRAVGGACVSGALTREGPLSAGGERGAPSGDPPDGPDAAAHARATPPPLPAMPPAAAEDAPTSVCFFQLLRADAGGLLETHAARLAALPAALAKDGHSFDELAAGVAAACASAGVPAGVPDREGAARAAALAASGYRVEAAFQARSGRTDQALLFLGRGLEVG